MSFAIWDLLSSDSAEQPAGYCDDSSVEQPAGDLIMKRGSSGHQKQMRKAATPVCASTSLCAFARLPLEIYQQLL